MKTAGILKLKVHLREYLNQVKAGNEVLMTDRGKPVARLVPSHRLEREESHWPKWKNKVSSDLGRASFRNNSGAYPEHRTQKDSFEKPLWMKETAGLLWTQDNPQHLEIVCLDQNLREAGHEGGFTVLPEQRVLI